jgi:adenylosuccinate synthase
MALTKLDVLDGFDEIRICTHYRIGDRVLNHFPSGMTEQAQVQPVFETVKGWKGSTRGARSWTQLPGEAVKYVRRLEELVGKPVALLSTSPEREDVILMRDPFEK